MAGHSKWANIKHKKGATDAKRGKIFTKVAKEITMSARLGGGDPAGNPRLRLAMQQARAVNMPNDNIKRAIQKGTGEIEGQTLEEITLEGYGPGGLGILLECMTDNRNRAVADVRAKLNKAGGAMAEAGAVAWNFTRKAVISIETEDVRTGDETYDIYAPLEAFDSVRTALEDAGFTISAAGLQFVPNQSLELTGAQAAAALKLLDALDDLDDVQNVYSNLEIDDEELERLEG
jgi:YebC/PmpR family DNA-binding regulatory protein